MICPICYLDFKPTHPRQIYCSVRCQNCATQRRWQKRHKGEPPKKFVIVTCAYDKCGKKFKSPIGKRKMKYCCARHAKLDISQKRRADLSRHTLERTKYPSHPMTREEERHVRQVMDLPAQNRASYMEGWTIQMRNYAKQLYLNASPRYIPDEY